MKHENECVLKSNKSLAENKIKKETEQLLSKYKHGNIFHGHGKRKNEWTTEIILNLSQRLDLRSSKFIYLLQYKNKKPKIIAPTWNDEFLLPDGSYSVSDIQDYIECIIKNMKH